MPSYMMLCRCFADASADVWPSGYVCRSVGSTWLPSALGHGSPMELGAIPSSIHRVSMGFFL